MTEGAQALSAFEALAQSCQDAVLVHDSKRIVFANAGLVALLGFHDRAELVGCPLESVIYPDDLRQLEPPGLVPAGTREPMPQLRCVARDGSVLAVTASGSVCELDRQNAYVVVLRNVTALLELEDDLRRSQEELETRIEQSTIELTMARASVRREASVRGRAEVALQERDAQLQQAQKMEAVGRLAAGIAHDFNNMLSVILSYSHMLQLATPPDSAVHEQLSEMKRAAERAADLSHQLLAFSKHRVWEPKIVDPALVLAGLDRMLKRIVGEDLHLRVSGAQGLTKIRIDPNQLEQVIVNLVINARDAMPNGGRLSIELANARIEASPNSRAPRDPAAGEYAVLTVSDTGVGMDSATLARIFEPFFTTKEPSRGTGLGLSIVYGIVKQSAGHVTVASEPRKGTTFKLYFPAVSGLSEPAPPPGPEAAVAAGQATVLVVEDSDAVLTAIRTILRDAGYHVLDARTPRAALSLAANHEGPLTLLLTDVVMPQMSGPQLAAALKPLHAEMRVMYLSGYADETLQQHGVLTSSLAFLQKPFTPDVLLSKVQEVLQQSA